MAKGSVRKKGKKWYYRFYVENESGNLVQREFVGTESKSETEAMLRKAMEDYEEKKFVAKSEKHLERYEDAKAVLGQYKYHLDKMANTPLLGSEYTAAEVIHELYPYHKDNRDFWLEMPQETISALDSLQLLIEPKENEVFLIEAEIAEDPENETKGISGTEETEDNDEQGTE